MKLVQLEYLVALSQYESVSQAAEHLYVSQPTISLAIKELEHELGYPLMIRSNRGITFTDQGKAVLGKARFILKNVSDIKDIQPEQNTVSGSVMAGCTTPQCKSLMLEVLSEIRRTFPAIQFSFQGANSREILQMIKTGACQLGVIHLEDVDASQFYSQVDKRELIYGELFKDRLAVMARWDHPLAGKDKVSTEELLEYPLLTPNKKVNPHLCRYYEEAGKGNQVISMDDASAVRRYAFMDYPVITMPLAASLDGNDLFRADLVPLNVEGITEAVTVCWVHGKYIDDAVKKVLEILLTKGGIYERNLSADKTGLRQV